MITNEEIDSKKRIIARYLNGEAVLCQGTTIASSVLQLVDQIEDLARAEAWKQPGTTVLPIMIVESKDIALDAFKNMPRETYEAYIAKKAAIAAKQEQLENDIKLLEGILAKPSGYYYYNGDGEEVKSYICDLCGHLPLNEEHEIAAHMEYCKCYECEGYSKEPYFKKSVLITALQALQQSKVKN